MRVAELGTLSLEFTRVSQITGDMRWYNAIARITNLFSEQQSNTKIPGLWPISVSPELMYLSYGTEFSFGGMSDSTYEYLPKQFALLGGRMPVYRQMYEEAISQAEKTIFFRPLTPDNADILISGEAYISQANASVMLYPRAQHLGCFVGGMVALGARLFRKDTHIALARKLTDGCVWSYRHGPHGIMPETIMFTPCSSSSTEDTCTWDRHRFEVAVYAHHPDKSLDAAVTIAQKHLPEGFVDIQDPHYFLRPEAIESVFIMYRITGDRKYLDDAWEMWLSISKITVTKLGNAEIKSLMEDGPDGLPLKDDRMESFWLAETLKYFYLIFSEPELISLDEWICNTEAHPFKRPKR